MENTSQFSGEAVEKLTRREMDILAHLAAKRSNQEIARLESLALSSVKWYVNQILGKLRANSRGNAVTRAIDLRLIQPDAQSAYPRNNLPRQLTSFIGRESEIAQVAELLGKYPLVTVTGSGGVGKTRLAIETAAGLLQHYPNGMWLVELAPLSDLELVPQTVVSVLGLRGEPSFSPTRQLVEFLRERQSLLILDNCEHVISAVADLAHELLHTSPRLSILATSREILGVKGEMVYRCPSLSLPGENSAESFQSEAVQLFAARAVSVFPAFTLNESSAAEVARICRQLDGIPLAIELAAARLRMLSPEQIAVRLGDAFHLLTVGSRTDLPRHHTLEAMIDWSYNLLSDAERLLLRQISVFAGSWSLEAAEVVCSDSPGGLLDHLGQLVDKSLVEAVPVGKSMRYRMLETIRLYARKQLVITEDEAQLRERHLDYFLAFSLEAETYLCGKYLREWRERVDMELDNLRAAMEWSLVGSVEKGLRLVSALQWYWQGRMNLVNESVSWLARLLEAEANGPEELRMAPDRRIARGKAINVIAHRGVKNSSLLAREAVEIFSQLGEKYRLDWAIALIWSGEMDLMEVLVIFREIGDRFYLTYVLWVMFMEAIWEGDLSRARQYLEESLALIREIGYLEGEATVLTALGWLIFLSGEPAKAIEFLKTAGRRNQAAGTIGKDHFPIYNLARIDLAQGNYQQSEQNFNIFLAKSQELGNIGKSIPTLGYLGWVAWASGNNDLADRYLAEALTLAEKFGGGLTPECYYVLARVAISRGNYSQAYAYLHNIDLIPSYHARKIDIVTYYTPLAPLLVQIYAILAVVERKMNYAAVLFASLESYTWLMNMLPPPEREEYRQALTAVRAALSPEEFAAAWAQGRAMKARQTLVYAMSYAPGEPNW